MTLESISLINFFKSEIDNARQHPQMTLNHLKNRKFDQENQFPHTIIPNIKYKTEEGSEGVEEAINYLQNTDKKKSLTLSESLCQAAYQAGLQLSKLNVIQNPQIYAQKIDRQVDKVCSGYFGQIEILVEYGFRNDPDIIPSIIVDDGDKQRTRRSILMNTKTRYVGIGVHEHSQYDYMVLILLTDRIDEGGCNCRIF